MCGVLRDIEVQSNTGNVGELLKSLSKCGLEVPDSVGELLWRQLQVLFLYLMLFKTRCDNIDHICTTWVG
jgi:hypothetical protein